MSYHHVVWVQQGSSDPCKATLYSDVERDEFLASLPAAATVVYSGGSSAKMREAFNQVRKAATPSEAAIKSRMAEDERLRDAQRGSAHDHIHSLAEIQAIVGAIHWG